MERTPEEQAEESTHLPEGVEPQTEEKGEEEGHSTDTLGDESEDGTNDSSA